MNRRQAMRTLALGATASIIPSSFVLALGAYSDLDRLIETHRAAFSAWIDAFDFADDSRADEDAKKLMKLALSAEQEAMRALLTYRPFDLAGVSKRLEYLRGQDGPWLGVQPEPWEVDAICASMMSESPTPSNPT